MNLDSFQSCTEHIRTASGVVTSLIPLFPFKTPPPTSVNRLAPAHTGQRPPRRTSELSIKSHEGVNTEGFCFLCNIAPVCASLFQLAFCCCCHHIFGKLFEPHLLQNATKSRKYGLLALIRTLAPQHTSFHSAPRE